MQGVSDGPAKRVLNQLTDEARAAARALVAASRHGALATLEPGTGDPLVTRVGLVASGNGTPLILTSALAAHTPALLADPRCALLVGEAGKGDPLAHPRLMLKCRAEALPRDSRAHAEARRIYLGAHPKARLYVDLPDFRFFALEMKSGRFNAGFGKAYALMRDDLID
jgi:putative heme iron utilization protein